MEFDIVIANPPFSLKNWGYEEAQNDPFRRFRFGIPPKGYGDYAFVQHMITTLNPRGRAGVVLPHGALFRGGAEGKIRKGILEEDLVEAVIGLPSNLFFGTGIPACLFIMNKNKPKERKGKVFFLYGANDFLCRSVPQVATTIRNAIPIGCKRTETLDCLKLLSTSQRINRTITTWKMRIGTHTEAVAEPSVSFQSQ